MVARESMAARVVDQHDVKRLFRADELDNLFQADAEAIRAHIQRVDPDDNDTVHDARDIQDKGIKPIPYHMVVSCTRVTVAPVVRLICLACLARHHCCLVWTCVGWNSIHRSPGST